VGFLGIGARLVLHPFGNLQLDDSVGTSSLANQGLFANNRAALIREQDLDAYRLTRHVIEWRHDLCLTKLETSAWCAHAPTPRSITPLDAEQVQEGSELC
jgi:hypothetical protein